MLLWRNTAAWIVVMFPFDGNAAHTLGQFTDISNDKWLYNPVWMDRIFYYRVISRSQCCWYSLYRCYGQAELARQSSLSITPGWQYLLKCTSDATGCCNLGASWNGSAGPGTPKLLTTAEDGCWKKYKTSGPAQSIFGSSGNISQSPVNVVLTTFFWPGPNPCEPNNGC